MPITDISFVGDDRSAKGAVHAGDVYPANCIYKHLVPGQNSFWVGAHITVDFNTENNIVLLQILGVICGDHLRMSQPAIPLIDVLTEVLSGFLLE
ncbi:MAG: hypothetical protein ACI9DH_000873 [Halioglobus sp.]|jgi:hypothetical protein